MLASFMFTFFYYFIFFFQAEDGIRDRLVTGVQTCALPISFDPEHVAQAVVYMASLPLDTNVQVMTVMATKMPYIGRG